MFTLYQGIKVLKFMGIKYESLYERDPVNKYLRENFYKEETNIFSYCSNSVPKTIPVFELS